MAKIIAQRIAICTAKLQQLKNALFLSHLLTESVDEGETKKEERIEREEEKRNKGTKK